MRKTLLVLVCFGLGICAFTIHAQAFKYPTSSASHAGDDFSRGVPGIVFGAFAIFLLVAIVYIWIKIQAESERKERLGALRKKSKAERKLYVQDLHQNGLSIAKISDDLGVTEHEIKQLLKK